MTPDPLADLAAQLSRTLGGALLGATDANNDGGSDDAAPLTLLPAARPTAPALLARAHPGGTRVQKDAAALYRRCLAHYRSRVQRNLPQDDVGAAGAYFVLACVAAIQQIDVSEPQLALVERQMRRMIGKHPAWQQAGAIERQSLFEQLALLGVLVGEAQFDARRQGAAARDHVARAARAYLQQLLGLNPDCLQLGAHGLELRVAAPQLAAEADR